MKREVSTVRRVLRSLPGYPLLRRARRRLEQGYESLRRVGTTQEHWSRVVMNRETRSIIRSLEPGKLKTLEISGSAWGKREHFKEYRQVSYPEFDLCGSPLDETFDLVIAEQVFEHLLWPHRAGRNVYRMLNPGGHFLLTLPFLIRIHASPTDCTRWTETGIKYLLAECGFSMDRIRTGSWGNRACVRANFPRWIYYRPLFHSLRNEPNFPVHVWAIAQK